MAGCGPVFCDEQRFAFFSKKLFLMIRAFSACLTFVVLSAVTGCTSDGPPAAAEESAPAGQAFAQAVADVAELTRKIRTGFESDDVDAAHGPLHDVGDRLKDVSELAVDSGLSESDQKRAEDSVNAMFEAFADVDKTLHGQEGATWEEVADTIEQALAELMSLREKVEG